MAIAIFGGTFDPIHIAHENIVKEASKLNEIRKVIVIPAGNPPHKTDKWVSFASYRLQMTEIALAGLKKIKVSRYEIKRKNKSYTLKTIKHFKKKYNDEKIYLIIGGDSFFSFEKWYKFEDILKIATLLVVERPGEDGNLNKHKKYLENKYSANVEFLKMETQDISSTELREKLLKKDYDLEGINPKVLNYIKQNKIYRKKRDLNKIFSAEQIKELREYERILFSLLSTYRVGHCVNVMYKAIDIAEIMGEDLFTAAVAGLLHDSAKEIKPSDYQDFLDKADASYVEIDKITHGPLAAYLLEPMFGINDENIYNSIYYHSTLRGDLSNLDAIVYLADKTEPARKYNGVKKIRKLIKKNDIKEALLLSLKLNADNLANNRQKAHKNSVAAYKTIKNM